MFVTALLCSGSVSLHAQSAGTLYKRGQAAEQREDFDAASTIYQKAAEKAPKDLRYRTALYRVRLSASGLHLTRGRKLLQAGDLQGALAEFMHASEIDPGNEAAVQEIARVRQRQGETAPAPAETLPETASKQEEIDTMGFADRAEAGIKRAPYAAHVGRRQGGVPGSRPGRRQSMCSSIPTSTPSASR